MFRKVPTLGNILVSAQLIKVSYFFCFNQIDSSFFLKGVPLVVACGTLRNFTFPYNFPKKCHKGEEGNCAFTSVCPIYSSLINHFIMKTVTLNLPENKEK